MYHSRAPYKKRVREGRRRRTHTQVPGNTHHFEDKVTQQCHRMMLFAGIRFIALKHGFGSVWMLKVAHRCGRSFFVVAKKV